MMTQVPQAIDRSILFTLLLWSLLRTTDDDVTFSPTQVLLIEIMTLVPVLPFPYLTRRLLRFLVEPRL